MTAQGSKSRRSYFYTWLLTAIIVGAIIYIIHLI